MADTSVFTDNYVGHPRANRHIGLDGGRVATINALVDTGRTRAAVTNGGVMHHGSFYTTFAPADDDLGAVAWLMGEHGGLGGHPFA